MYVRPISTLLEGGRSTPAIRATESSSALALFVLRVVAHDPHHALALHDLALVANLFHRRPDLHRFLSRPSLVPVDDPAPGQVVRGQLDENAIPREDPDEVLPHLPRDVGEHAVLVLELDAEHRVRQRLDHRGFHLNRLFLRHSTPQAATAIGSPRTRGPCSMTATDSSKCAERLPSRVRAVQPSSADRTTSGPPAFTIGSMASTIPGASRTPCPGCPKFGICGSSWRLEPIPCPTNSRTTENPAASTCVCTAKPMSDTRFPGRACATARWSACRVTSRRRWASPSMRPTANVSAASP